MLSILRVTGYHDTGIFFFGGCGENNVYYLEVDSLDDINAGIIIKKLIFHNTILNTINTVELTYPAENFSRQLCNGVLYYLRFSNEKSILHIHSVDCSTVHVSQITLLLNDIIEEPSIYRTEIKGIDNRYCLVYLSTSYTYETTHLLLFDFEDKTYYKVSPNFGLDSMFRIESIMSIVDNKFTPQKEEIILITGGFHFTEKYEMWKQVKGDIELEIKLIEHAIIFEKDYFFHKLKSGSSLEIENHQILESCPINKSIISYENNITKMTYTVVDFEENTTTRVEYDICMGKRTLFIYNNVLSNPVFTDGKLYSIETLDYERYSIIDLDTNQFVVILPSDEKIISFDKNIILTYKWLDKTNQQMVYLYDLSKNSINQKLLGIGFSNYDGNNITIFS